ncbi:leucyl aminopeptidase [Protaetiibacter intestinalis]|uniref:Probable cytosol aminopeptidase n=1 Tax=Protaetiibacter intestinalis TaxID=2419774 RepID=A0A387BDP6_9MICO|nr:leucyl aminopeptidase [Protaetiibacter intestinalis]AYF99176.1 leucyl aminopeptidase [Protaetiibacter intestinalis]
MTVAELGLSTAPATSTDADLLVLGVVKTPDGPELAAPADSFPELRAMLVSLGVTGGADEFRRAPAVDGSTAPIALVGLGATATRESLRAAAGCAGRQAAGNASLALGLPVADAHEAELVLEAAASGAYAFLDYKTGGDLDRRRPPRRIVLHVPAELDATGIVERAAATATALHTVRDLVNTPAADLYPETFAQRAGELAEGLPVSVEVLREAELAEGGYGGILSVGAGSARPPRLVVLRYEPAGAAAHLALVGKGITFDSGGLSLKPPSSMPTMKYDMTGAATALAVLLATARLGLPVRVTAWLCLAENMPSGSALRPGDVLRTWSGTTVEVTNTDAEGRLVLADGLAAAAAERPDLLVDLATLTGAARIAMGERTTAVMGDDEAVGAVIAAAARSDEPMWAMPLPPELRSVLDSDIADLANAKLGHTAGGMLVAGHFLRGFAGTAGGDGPGAARGWAHLDLAGPAYNSGSPYGGIGRGPTAVAVRTMLALTADLAGA